MSDLSNIVDKATEAIVNGQQLSTEGLNDLAKIFYMAANKISDAISKSAGLHREIVPQLPTEDIDDDVIYMVLDASATGSDVYDEWMWIENAWEHIGSTRVDLSDYYTKTEVDTALSGKASTSDIPTTLASLSDDTTHRLVSDTEKNTWNGKSNFSGSYSDLTDKPTIPTTLASLSDDTTHRLVTDTEKSTWNGKQDVLTFDDTPTENSNNPVKSGGVFSKIGDKVKKLAKQTTNYTCTSTNYAYTNAFVICPAGHVYIVRARAKYVNQEPTGIVASVDKYGMDAFQRLAEGISTVNFMLLPGDDAYIWAKWSAASQNRVEIDILDVTL